MIIFYKKTVFSQHFKNVQLMLRKQLVISGLQRITTFDGLPKYF